MSPGELSQAIKRLVAKNLMLGSANNTAIAERDAAIAERDAARYDIVLLKKNNVDLQGQIGKLQEESVKATLQIKTLQAQVLKLELEFASFKKKYGDQKDENDQLKIANATLQSYFNALEEMGETGEDGAGAAGVGAAGAAADPEDGEYENITSAEGSSPSNASPSNSNASKQT